MDTTTNFPFIVDEQKLKTTIHFAVESAIKDIVLKSKIEKPVQLKEASEFFSMTPKTLMKRAFAGEIPVHRLPGKRSPYYFYKSDIEKAIRNGKVEVLQNINY